MKFIVSMKIDGRVDCEVEADSFEEAFEKANKSHPTFTEVRNMEVVDSAPVNATDENGNRKDY